MKLTALNYKSVTWQESRPIGVELKTSAPTGLILNENDFEAIVNKLTNADKDEQKKCQDFLSIIDIDKSIYWIRELALKVPVDRLANFRTKQGRRFRDKTDIFKLMNYSNTEFARVLINQGLLTPEIYKRLLPEIKKEIVDNHKHPFYEFHIKIKDHLNFLDEEDKLTKLGDL